MGKIMKNSVEYGTTTTINDVTVNGTSVVTSGVASIPLVSSTSAGVAPKGASVSSQSQSTKFLREDGSWATPSYTSIKKSSVSLTFDSSGRSTINFSMGRIIAVNFQTTSYTYTLRYLNTSQTLIYLRDPNTLALITNYSDSIAVDIYYITT